jgi:hypothetical protein
MNFIDLGEDMGPGRALVNTAMNFRVLLHVGIFLVS